MFHRIRAAWRALFRSTTALPATTLPVASGITISHAAFWEAARHGGTALEGEAIFRRPDPMPGVIPNGMAMDSLPATSDLMSYAMQQQYHEGIGFLGYPYLAELSQRAEYRHICSIWAQNCTRKWIKLNGDEEKCAKINAELKRLDIRAVFREAIEKECMFGRIQLFLDFGDFDKPNEIRAPLRMDSNKINAKRPLKRVTILEPMWSYPGMYDAQNPLAPDFYNPSDWYVSGRIVHASRLLTMVGRPMPFMLKPAYAFGGVSLVQMCKPYVDNWLRARQSGSDLLYSFSTPVLKTDMDGVLQPGGDYKSFYDRADLFNKLRDNRGLLTIDKEREDFANVSVPINGVDKMVAQALEQIASVSSIPLSELLGTTPSGLNASSDGEIRVFYAKVIGYSEKVIGPALDTILEVIQLSLFGKIDTDITYEFESLWDMSEKDKADIRKADADADAVYIANGVIDPDESRQRLNDKDGGMYNGMLAGAAPDATDNKEGSEV